LPTLEKTNSREHFDALIVGAGVIGLAIAWRAASQGAKTLVLDRGRSGKGATHVAAGMLAPVTEAHFGEAELVALNLESARRYPEFVAELERETGIETGYQACGTLAVALDHDDAELLHRLHEYQRSLGLEAEWLTARECRRLEPGLAPGVAGGIRSTVDHQVDPRALSAALELALERAGARLVTDAPVDAVTIESGRVSGVELASGETVAADRVVLAVGWRSSEVALPPSARVPVRPVKGQILRLSGAASAPLAGRVVRTPRVYIVPRANGDVVVGATVEERGADTSVTAGGILELLREAYAALPGIVELPLAETGAGLRPASPDNAPIVGEGAIPGLLWATAHWRNGILLAPLTADAIADLLLGGEAQAGLEPYRPDRFAGREPGGDRRRERQGVAN
jgi:glycine oxidase